jgi:hypothetical protein
MKGTSALNWEAIRNFAELQILTRASYVALMVIPIVAGCWSSIRVILSHYDRNAWMAPQSLGTITSELSTMPATRQLLPTDAAASSVPGRSRVIQERLPIPLPKVWVFGYLSALFLVVGHSIYQTLAPEAVKANRRIEYITVQRDLRTRQRGTPEDTQATADEANHVYTQYSLHGHWGFRAASLLFYVLSLCCVTLVIGLQFIAVFKATWPGAPVE